MIDIKIVYQILTDNPMDYEFPEIEEYFIYNPKLMYILLVSPSAMGGGMVELN